MVIGCCVKNCKSFSDGAVRGHKIGFFGFPFKNKELLQLWMAVVPSKGKIGKYSFICSNHFCKSDFASLNGAKKFCLKKDAVPSIFEFHALSDITEGTSSEDMQNQKTTVKDMSVQTSTTFTSTNEKRYKMEQKIKNAQLRLRRREMKLSSVTELVKLLKGKKNCSDALEEVLLHRFTDFKLDLFKNELYNEKVSKTKKRYSEKMKEFASTLYLYSPKAYHFVRSRLNLPHESTIRSWIS